MDCRLADEKDFLRQEIENEKKDVVDRLKRENQILRDQLEGTRYAQQHSLPSLKMIFPKIRATRHTTELADDVR